MDRLLRSSLVVVQRWPSFTGGDELIAPSLPRAECTSVFARLVHTGRIVKQAALYPGAFDIARSPGWARAYDALYPAAAEIEDAELLTVGRGMSEAAARLGIPATLVR